MSGKVCKGILAFGLFAFIIPLTVQGQSAPASSIVAAVDTAGAAPMEPSESGPSDRDPLPVRSAVDEPFRKPLPVSPQPFDYTRMKPDDFNLDIVRTANPIKLDGRLTEADWQMAPVAKDFYQLEPSEGKPATQPTEVRVLYDNENLYIGVICFDAEPGRIMAPDMQRDTRLGFSNDNVMVVISSLDGYREAYEFQTNPNGARFDSFASKEGNSTDRDWNGYWNVASARTDYGWSAEFAIPFHVFRFPSRPAQTWAVNFGRRIQRAREESYWVPLSRRDGRQALYRFAKGGRLTGLSNIRPGGKLQVVPFSVLGAQGARFNRVDPSAPSTPIAVTGFNNAMERQFGGDLKWSVTSGTTLNATVNPDFAQVEADDQVVNLSRFELQFPEKRPFFLERSDIFTLAQGGGGGRGGGGGGGGGGRGGDVPQIFFSRRIGRGLPDGSPVPIDLGMRFTGKIRGTTIGFLNVQTRETVFTEEDSIKIEPVTNWQALRISQDIGARSSMGILATFREPNPAGNDRAGMAIPRYAAKDFNRVVGFDGNLAFSKSQHQLQVMYARSWTDTLQARGGEYVWRIQERWQNRWLGYGISYMETGRNFIAQSGFVTQTNVRRAGIGTNFNAFIRKFGIRQISGGIRTNYLSRIDRPFSDPETWQVSPNLFLELERGLWLSGSWNRNFDTLSDSSRINSVDFVPGSYRYDQGNLSFFTDPGKAVSVEGEMRFGRFYNADLMSLAGTFSLKPNPRFSAEPGITWTRVTRSGAVAPGGGKYDYNSRMIPRVRSTYSFTPNLTVSAFVQFNVDKRRAPDAFHLNTVTTNLLVSYRSPYGHSFFLAFNQFHDDALDAIDSFDPFARKPLRMRGQTLVAKVSYLFNL